MAYDFILVIVVTSLFVIHTFSHTLTLLSGLYQMLLDSAAVIECLAVVFRERLVLILNCCYTGSRGWLSVMSVFRSRLQVGM